MKSKILFLALFLGLFTTSVQAKSINLLNASYDPTREFYEEYNAAFAKYWKGLTGDDVTVNVRTIRGLPARLTATPEAPPIPDRVEIRGEIFLSFDEFNRINQQQDELGAERYANPRNLAAGTLKQLDSALVAERRLEIVLYGLGHSQPAGLGASQTAGQGAMRGGRIIGARGRRRTKKRGASADRAWPAT